MFMVDDKALQQNMNSIAAAVQASTGRTVKAMGLNAKDRTLEALNKYVDKPTPFTVRPGAYQASNPFMQDGDIVSTFSIAEIRSGAMLVNRVPSVDSLVLGFISAAMPIVRASWRGARAARGRPEGASPTEHRRDVYGYRGVGHFAKHWRCRSGRAGKIVPPVRETVSVGSGPILRRLGVVGIATV